MGEPDDLAAGIGSLIVIANDHPGVGVADLSGPQHGAVSSQIGGDVLAGGVDLGLLDVQHIQVPLVDDILGAANGDGNGVAVGLAGVHVQAHVGQTAGDSLGHVSHADLIGLALVGSEGNNGHTVAGLQVLQRIVGIIVVVLHIGDVHVDGEGVVAGDLGQAVRRRAARIAAVGADALQGDEVGANAVDLHQLGAGNDDVGDEVGVNGADIDFNGNAVVGQVSDLGQRRSLILGSGSDGASVIAVLDTILTALALPSGGGSGGLGVAGVPNTGVPAVDGDLGSVREGAVPVAEAVQAGEAGSGAPVGGAGAVVGAVGVIAAQAQGLLLGGRGILAVSDLSGVSEVSGQLEGADGDFLVAPLVGGMTEIIVGGIILVVLQAQVLEVLLAELEGHLVVGGADNTAVDVRVDLAVVAGHVHRLSVGDSQVLSAGNQGGSAVSNHGGLQGVQSQLAGLFTIDSGSAVEFEAIEQAGDIGDLGHVHGPAGVNEALDLALVAQRAQQHLSKGEAGQRVAGLEGAVTVAADDASGLAVADDARKRVARGDIGIRRGGVGEVAGGLGADQQGDDDLRRGSAGQLSRRLEAAVIVSGDNTDPVQNGNGFLVLNLILVGEIPVLGGSRANRDQGHGHDQCENQGQEFLH